MELFILYAFLGTGVVSSCFWLTKTSSFLASSLKLSRSGGTMFLIALGTSFPELATCLSAVHVGLFSAANNNVFGSIAFNLLIIGLTFLVIDFKDKSFQDRHSIWILIGFILILFLGSQFRWTYYLSWGSIVIHTLSILLIICYYCYLKYLSQNGGVQEEETAKVSKKKAVIVYVSSVIVVGLLSFWLVKISEKIAVEFGLTQGILGFFLIAIPTSLPELSSIFIVAKQTKSVNEILNIVVQSNLLNCVLIPICDIICISHRVEYLSGHQASLFILSLIVLILPILVQKKSLNHMRLRGGGIIILYIIIAVFMLP